jgi:excisionase family DNA binding protein
MESDQLSQEIIAALYATVHAATIEAIQKNLDLVPKSKESFTSDYLSADQASQYLKIKINTLYSKVEKGELSCYRSGKRKLLFSLKELEQYVLSKRGKSTQDINNEVNSYINLKK